MAKMKSARVLGAHRSCHRQELYKNESVITTGKLMKLIHMLLLCSSYYCHCHAGYLTTNNLPQPRSTSLNHQSYLNNNKFERRGQDLEKLVLESKLSQAPYSGKHLKKLLSRPRQILSSFVPQTLTKQLVIKRPEALAATAINLKRIHDKLHLHQLSQQQQQQQQPPQQSQPLALRLEPVRIIPAASPGDLFGLPSMALVKHQHQAPPSLPPPPPPRQIVVVKKVSSQQPRFVLQHYPQQGPQIPNHSHHQLQHQKQHELELEAEEELEEPAGEMERELEQIDHLIKSEFETRINLNEHLLEGGRPVAHQPPRLKQQQQQQLLVSYIRNDSSPTMNQLEEASEENHSESKSNEPMAKTAANSLDNDEPPWRPTELPPSHMAEVKAGRRAAASRAVWPPLSLASGEQGREREREEREQLLNYRPLNFELGQRKSHQHEQQPFKPTALETIAQLRLNTTNQNHNNNSNNNNHGGEQASTSDNKSLLQQQHHLVPSAQPNNSTRLGNAKQIGQRQQQQQWHAMTQTIASSSSPSSSPPSSQATSQQQADLDPLTQPMAFGRLAAGNSQQTVTGRLIGGRPLAGGGNINDKLGQQEPSQSEPDQSHTLTSSHNVQRLVSSGTQTQTQAQRYQNQSAGEPQEQLMTALSSQDYKDSATVSAALGVLASPTQAPASPNNLNETLRRLRETKARIRQLQSELNRTGGAQLMLWRPPVAAAAVRANTLDSELEEHQRNLSRLQHPFDDDDATFSRPLDAAPNTSTSLSAGDWFRAVWPPDGGGDLERQPPSTNGKLVPVASTGGWVRAQGALNMPLAVYRQGAGPLTAPARLVASAFGQAAARSLGHTPTRAPLPALDGRHRTATPLGATPSLQESAIGDNYQSSGSSNNNGRRPPPSTTTTSFQKPGSGSGGGTTPADLEVTSESATTDSSSSSSSSSSSTDNVVGQHNWQDANANADANSNANVAHHQRHLHHQHQPTTQSPHWKPSIASHSLQGQTSSASDQHQHRKVVSLLTELNDATSDRPLGRPTLVDGSISGQVEQRAAEAEAAVAANSWFTRLFGGPQIGPPKEENDAGKQDGGKLSTERVLHTLIAFSCSIALICLVVVLALVRLQVSRSHRKRRKAGGSAADDRCRPQVNVVGTNRLHAFSPLDWRRFGATREPKAISSSQPTTTTTSAGATSVSERSQHDKLILDGTMRNVSLLSRQQLVAPFAVGKGKSKVGLKSASNKKKAPGSPLELQLGSLNQAQHQLAPPPMLNRSCCHCVACSESWLFRSEGGGQDGGELVAIAGKSSLKTNQSKQSGRCSSGYYHPAPRGKLPFGAASSVNKFLINHSTSSSGDNLKTGDPHAHHQLHYLQQQQQRQPIGGTRLRMMSAIDERRSPSPLGAHRHRHHHHRQQQLLMAAIGPHQDEEIQCTCAGNLSSTYDGDGNHLCATSTASSPGAPSDDGECRGHLNSHECNCQMKLDNENENESENENEHEHDENEDEGRNGKVADHSINARISAKSVANNCRAEEMAAGYRPLPVVQPSRAQEGSAAANGSEPAAASDAVDSTSAKRITSAAMSGELAASQKGDQNDVGRDNNRRHASKQRASNGPHDFMNNIKFNMKTRDGHETAPTNIQSARGQHGDGDGQGEEDNDDEPVKIIESAPGEKKRGLRQASGNAKLAQANAGQPTLFSLAATRIHGRFRKTLIGDDVSGKPEAAKRPK